MVIRSSEGHSRSSLHMANDRRVSSRRPAINSRCAFGGETT